MPAPLVRVLDAAWAALAEHHRLGFLAAGAAVAVVRREPADGTPFGARLRRLVAELRPAGLVVLGAGSIPLATAGDREAFVRAAAADESGRAREPPLLGGRRGDRRGGRGPRRASPISPPTTRCRAGSRRPPPSPSATSRRGGGWRWTSTRRSTSCSSRARAARRGCPDRIDPSAALVRDRLAALRAVAADPGAELLVAGRTSATDLRWLERHTRSRTRALVEERGLRTSAAGAELGRPNRRPPRSVLGELLERDGPGSLGRHVAALSDGALIDSRVLMAHRLGADEGGWPTAEDRFASDLLLAGPDRRPVAARAHGGRPRRAGPDPARRARARRARGAARASGVGRGRGTAVPYDRRDGRRSRPTRGVARPRPAPRPRVGRRGRGARRAAPGHDHDRGTDLVRPVHGPCPV